MCGSFLSIMLLTSFSWVLLLVKVEVSQLFFPGPVWVVGKFYLNVNRGCNNKGIA